MSKKDKVEVQARVISACPNCTFWVKLENGHKALAYLSGKMRANLIRLVAGDEVTVQLSPYDLTRGRIVYRKR